MRLDLYGVCLTSETVEPKFASANEDARLVAQYEDMQLTPVSDTGPLRLRFRVRDDEFVRLIGAMCCTVDEDHS